MCLWKLVWFVGDPRVVDDLMIMVAGWVTRHDTVLNIYLTEQQCGCSLQF